MNGAKNGAAASCVDGNTHQISQENGSRLREYGIVGDRQRTARQLQLTMDKQSTNSYDYKSSSMKTISTPRDAGSIIENL